MLKVSLGPGIVRAKMGSRLRDNVKNIFECFCEVAGPQGNDPAWILQKYPSTYKDESVLKNVPKFAYPCKLENKCVELYSFVFTDLSSKYTFGYCRHDPNSQTALVILSYLPWHESFYKLLDSIASITNSNGNQSLWSFLEKILQAEVPNPGLSVRVTSHLTEFTCQAPKLCQLPSYPENKNVKEYYSIDPINMLQIFASMLYERRIIITSTRLSKLSACVQAANSMIYPMCWQHLFIPVLPHHLIDYLNAPMPYLIGLPEILLQSIRMSELGDIVMLNADTNVLTTPHNDLSSLPQDVMTTLKRQLRSINKQTSGDALSRAFLRALVQLIGGYRDALKFHQGEKITFNEEAFVESRPSSMQPFLRKMLQLQIFQQFIEERLDMLNAGLGFSDEFELETCNYMDKSSGTIKHQYKEWLHTVRKEGASFFKAFKGRVRERGKDVRIAYKGLRSKLKEEKQGDEKSNSAPSSPTQLRKRDISMPLQNNKYNALDLASSPDLSPMNINLDLMSDLRDMIFKDCSPSSVQKTLMGTEITMVAVPPPPPPSGSIPKSKPAEPDLIRLDSVSSMEEVASPTPDSCTGVENPLYPYFIPKQLQEEAAPTSSTSSNNFKQNIDFFNNLSTSNSFSKSPPQNSKPFSFGNQSAESNSIHFPSSSNSFTPPGRSTFSPSYPKLPSNGFPVPATSIIAPEAKDIIASIMKNNSYAGKPLGSYPGQKSNSIYPTIPASKPTTSYSSRAAFLNDQLGPVPSIAPKSSVSEWTKFD